MDKRFLGIFGAIIAVFIVIFAVSSSKNPTPPAEKNGSLASLSNTQAPWPAETSHLRERLLASNLPILTAEGTALHIHQHIDIYIHGQPLAVPADIGLTTTITSPIHTHDTSGIIHVESPDRNASYSLKQFFNVWGVNLTDTQIGGYKNDSVNRLNAYSNGQLVKDPVNLKLTAHEEIIIIYGSDQEKLAQIPKSYTFPQGL